MKKPLKVGWMAINPDEQIVKVRVDRVKNGEYPFVISPIIPMDGFTSIHFADLSFMELFPTCQAAEKATLEKLHKRYADERRALRVQQQKYKWALRNVEDYKNFGKLQNPFFTVK